MQRLVQILSTTPHRYIVAKGPQYGEFELADNMWGAPSVPQTNVLPLVDVVITHGGNNTTTECFHFGKPMVVLPVFWDQYDNAQRVAEKGFGRRLATYDFDAGELTDAVDALLANEPLRRRMATLAASIQAWAAFAEGRAHRSCAMEARLPQGPGGLGRPSGQRVYFRTATSAPSEHATAACRFPARIHPRTSVPGRTTNVAGVLGLSCRQGTLGSGRGRDE